MKDGSLFFVLAVSQPVFTAQQNISFQLLGAWFTLTAYLRDFKKNLNNYTCQCFFTTNLLTLK